MSKQFYIKQFSLAYAQFQNQTISISNNSAFIVKKHFYFNLFSFVKLF